MRLDASSQAMRDQVLSARQIQRDRFGPVTTRLNARMNSRQLRKFCVLNAEGKALLQSAVDNLGLSARAHDRILRMARTIADLDASETIQVAHLSEAINYRSLDRKLWKR